MDELFYVSATTLARRIRDRELSSEEIDVRRLRVATYTHHAGAEPTPETAETCRRAARVLAGMGAFVEETLPPRIEEADHITRQYWQRPESVSADEWAADGAA